MPKMLFQLYIDPSQYDYIVKKAREEGKSRAALVRDAIKEYKKKNPLSRRVYTRK